MLECGFFQARSQFIPLAVPALIRLAYRAPGTVKPVSLVQRTMTDVPAGAIVDGIPGG